VADLVTPEQVAQWADIPDNNDDATLAWCATSASRWVRTHCGRSFHVEEEQDASARYFKPLAPYLVQLDDCYDAATVTVATDDADDGNYAQSWDAADFQLNPVAGIGPTGETGWPYTKLVAIKHRVFPFHARTSVKVTAKWGWEALPGDVFQAALMVAAEMHKAKSGGFEVFTADGQFTPTRRNFVVRDLLNPYRTRRANDARFVVS
jgi:hypothetical protein